MLTTTEKLNLLKKLQNQWDDQTIVVGACGGFNNNENMNDLIDQIIYEIEDGDLK
ncbi:MAG: hypothetical protein KJI71_01260 [Patescibacteria group bacterium]|nr:hypothetical protein [Patescibacteria group bacterium]